MKNIISMGIMLFLLSSCGNSNKPTEKQATEKPATDSNSVRLTDAQYKNADIIIGRLEEKNISSIIRVNGKIDVPPQNMVSVSVPLGGYLISTRLLPGMHINKGEIIATVEDQQYIQLQQDYLLARSKWHFAELDYDRQKELNQSQASSDKVMQQAQSEMNSQQITTNALAEKLRLIHINPNTISANNISRNINIYSTITGFVSKVNVNIGKYINPADVLFELIDPTDIHLNLKVFEKDVAQLMIGQKLTAYSNINRDKKYPCEIILISRDISSDGIADVHCHFEKYDKTLLPGMYMNAEVELKNRSSKTLPEAAIVNFEGKDYVFEATANKQFAMREVGLGTKENGFININNANLFTDKGIVIKGAYTLLMKLKNREDENAD